MGSICSCLKTTNKMDAFGSFYGDTDILPEINKTDDQISPPPNATLKDFKKIKVLGKGSFGKVVLTQLSLNHQLYAMKILKKKFILKKNQITQTKTERFLLEKVDNPFIVKLYYAFQDEHCLYFITDFMQGGELFFHLKRTHQYQDAEVIFYASEIICAIDYMHKNNFIYRDLKPENILIDRNGHIKITDFGLSKVLDNNKTKTYTICGTIEYLAPEILIDKGYDKTCDWFSLGVLIYEMLCGKHPFQRKRNEEECIKIYYQPVKIPKNLSKEAIDLIERLLNPNPKERLGHNGAMEIMNHRYFNGVDFEKIRKKMYKPPFVPELQSETDLRYFDEGFTKDKLDSVVNNKNGSAPKEDVFGDFSYHPVVDVNDAKDKDKDGDNSITTMKHNLNKSNNSKK